MYFQNKLVTFSHISNPITGWWPFHDFVKVLFILCEHLWSGLLCSFNLYYKLYLFIQLLTFIGIFILNCIVKCSWFVLLVWCRLSELLLGNAHKLQIFVKTSRLLNVGKIGCVIQIGVQKLKQLMQQTIYFWVQHIYEVVLIPSAVVIT